MNATKLEQKKEEKCSQIIGMPHLDCQQLLRETMTTIFISLFKKILEISSLITITLDAREDEVIVNFKLLYGYAALLPEEEERYKKFTKSIQRRAATIGGQDMNDYPLKMLIFNRARLVKNSKNRIPYGVELIQKYKRDSWIVLLKIKNKLKSSTEL